MLAQKLVLPVKSSMNCDAARRKWSIGLAEIWRGFKNDRGTDSDGTKGKRRGGSLENIPAIFFRMNKRTFVSRCTVGEKMRESSVRTDDERKQRTPSVFQCERSHVHLRDERLQSTHEEVRRTMRRTELIPELHVLSAAVVTNFCQFTEQTRLTASSQPDRKKIADTRVATRNIRR